MNFDVLEVSPMKAGRMNFENAVGYKGAYVDQNNLDHSIYIVHGINQKKGLQFIFDVTSDTLHQVDREFPTTLLPIRKKESVTPMRDVPGKFDQRTFDSKDYLLSRKSNIRPALQF